MTNEPMTNEPMTNEPMTNEPMTNEPMTNELLDEIERLRAENTAMRYHIANLLEIADLALYYAPGEIGENYELASGMVERARAVVAAHPAAESEA